MSAEVQYEVQYEVKEVNSSSSPEIVSTIVEESDEAPASTTTALIPFPQKQNWDWSALQDLVGFSIDGDARKRIRKALERQGFDLWHFMAYLQRFPLGRCKSPTGLLIRKAETLNSELKHLDPDESVPPISKAERERRMLAEIFAERERYACPRCHDTGRVPGKFIRKPVDAPCPDCELGKEAWAEDHREAARQLHYVEPEERKKRLEMIAERGGDVDRIESLMGCQR